MIVFYLPLIFISVSLNMCTMKFQNRNCHIITKMEIRILLDPTRHNYAILPTLLRDLLRNSRKRQLPSPDYPVHLSQRLLVDT